MAAISLQVDSLRALQSRLNSSIDQAIALEEGSNGQLSAELALKLQQLRDQAIELQIEVSNPVLENLQRGFMPVVNLALRIAVDLNLFELINEPTSLKEIAQKTGADGILLLRILRLLRAVHYVKEETSEHYSVTPLGKALTMPSLRDWIKTTFDLLNPSYHVIPTFLAKNGYKDIQDLSNNPFLQLWGNNFFEHLAKHPHLQADFDSAMALQELRPQMSIPQYPFSEVKNKLSKDPDAVTFVDVGGGRGQYLARVIEENPELPGRFILQDLSSTTVAVDQKHTKFEVMSHDFFTPQPVRGAKFYHLRGILHDWPDVECVKILENLRSAWEPGYSKLLIQSMVISDASDIQGELMTDLNMWVCCGIERDETQFTELLNKGGFRVDRIVKAKIGTYAVIEADLL